LRTRLKPRQKPQALACGFPPRELRHSTRRRFPKPKAFSWCSNSFLRLELLEKTQNPAVRTTSCPKNSRVSKGRFLVASSSRPDCRHEGIGLWLLSSTGVPLVEPCSSKCPVHHCPPRGAASLPERISRPARPRGLKLLQGYRATRWSYCPPKYAQGPGRR